MSLYKYSSQWGSPVSFQCYILYYIIYILYSFQYIYYIDVCMYIYTKIKICRHTYILYVSIYNRKIQVVGCPSSFFCFVFIYYFCLFT